MKTAVYFVSVALLTLVLMGCESPEKKDMNSAKKEISEGNFRVALSYLDRIILRDQSSAWAVSAEKDAAKILQYDLKDFKGCLKYYKLVVLYSKDITDRANSQKQIAQVYLDNLNDYQQAITEYNKLIELPHSIEEESKYRLAIARSYYYLGNFQQAESEANDLDRKNLSEEVRYDVLILKANIHLVQKHHQQAAEIYVELISKFPVRARKEDLSLSLALCYEELKDYDKALSVLNSIKNSYKPTEYIDLRIKRLIERQKNQPKKRLKK